MPILFQVHSWYSLLEGASSLETLLARAAASGYKSLALTDTNNLYGAVPFIQQAQNHGLRPILGVCLRQGRSRCVALIADQTGYRNLCRILSRLHLGDPPPSLVDLLRKNSEGLHVLVDEIELAEQLREAMGDRLWVEVVRPGRTAEEERQLLEASRRLRLPLIASAATHFAGPEEYQVFRLITAIRRLTLLDRMPRQLSITSDHHLIAPKVLRERFRDLPEAVANTDVLAHQLRADVLPNRVILPPALVPRHLEAAQFLHALCERGLRRRDLGEDLHARGRLREELAVIVAGGLAGYFLVVRDIARYARHKKYGIALRGSAGNSLVCFLLDITDVNPLRFNLPMERFLHPGRTDLPDIDLDFDWKVRDDVIAYVFRRHGPEHTAMISSHLFLQPRSAFREAAKAHGLSNEQIGMLLENMPMRVERLASGEELEIINNKLKMGNWGKVPQGFPLEPGRWPRILADARLLLGRPHHLSIHPGGVVITPRAIEDHVPLQRAPKGIVITQFEKDAVEAIGLVKIDLLGNRALSTVDESLRYAKYQVSSAKDERQRGIDFGPSSLSLDAFLNDPATVALLQRGDTMGVNQIESPGMRHLLIQMRSRCLDDVIQALAVIRPGPAVGGRKEQYIRRRRGLEPISYVHPKLEPVLRNTCGLMIYEDDVLHVVQAMTGMPAASADCFRKRIVKHRTEAEALALGKDFIDACIDNGVPADVAADQWRQLVAFNRYCFCKSHAVSYGLIAWRTAYLKTHHPLLFWTAALNNNQGMYPRRVYIEAVRRAGILLRLPCVNRSRGPFAIEGDAIRVGLQVIASLDEKLCATIVAEREDRGPYHDLADFRRRVKPGPEALDLLIRSGAMDFTNRPRPALYLEADLQDKALGVAGRLFEDDSQLAWTPADYATERRWVEEARLLGFTVGVPMLSLFRELLPTKRVTSRQLSEYIGQKVQVAGLVATCRHTETVHGEEMQFISLEDEDGLIDLTLFPGLCPPVAYMTMGPYRATGMVEEQLGVITVTAHELQLLKQ